MTAEQRAQAVDETAVVKSGRCRAEMCECLTRST